MTRFNCSDNLISLLSSWPRKYLLVLSIAVPIVLLWSHSPAVIALVDKKSIDDKKPVTILVLGDSISAGYGIPEGKGWVSLLQKQVSESQSALKIINDSVSGDTTAGGLARLPNALKEVKPDWVLIALGGNDGLRGQSLRAMRENLIGLIMLCREYGSKALLLGMKLPPNYGKPYTQGFEQVYEKVSLETKTPLLPFFIEGAGGVTGYMQEDRIHPNTKAQPIILNNVWQFLEPYLMVSALAEPVLTEPVLPETMLRAPLLTKP